MLCERCLAATEPQTERTPSRGQRRGDKGNAGEAEADPRQERIGPGANLVAGAIALAHTFKNLVTAGATPESKTLGDLRLLHGVRKFPQRVKCAVLAWRAVEQALAQTAGEAIVTTEAES